MLLNILIGTACVCFILKFLFDEHYRQENQKRMNKFTSLLDKLLPKAFPSLFENEIPDGQVTDAPLTGFVDPSTIPNESRLPPELEEFLDNSPRMAELALRTDLKSITYSILESHSFQISFEEAEKKAVEVILKIHAQATNPLPEEIEILIPKSEADVNPVPEIPSV